MKFRIIKNAILSLSAFLIINTVNAQENGLINNSKTAYMPLKSINFNDCRWTNGFWADKQKLCMDVMVPNLGRLMEDNEITHFYENFRVAANLSKGEFRGWSFSDGDFYKYMEALTYKYALTKDESLNRKLDEYIDVIGKAQMPDGYIHTMIQIGHGINAYQHAWQKNFETKNGRFERDGDHELYNFGHLMTAACMHYRITGKTNFLNIAIKASDMLIEKFKVPSPTLAALELNPPQYMGLVEMYRTTSNKKYLDLAETFLDMRGTAQKSENWGHGLDYAQKRTPFREETEAIGHAVMANYLYAGVADIYAETGEKAVLDALERIWKDIITKRMFITGAAGPHHFGLSKNKDFVSESFGKDYELPNLGAYNETCANIGDAMFNWRMFLTSGDARFADVMELIWYNSALAGISDDGKNFFYTNPLKHVVGHPNTTKDNGIRQPSLSVFCCPPNIIRTIANMHTYAYTTSDKGVWVNLYGGNTLDTKLQDGTNIKLNQVSNYPWEGLVKITVDIEKSKDFSIMLRIPAWANGTTIKVNGKPITEAIKAGTYFDLKQTWKKGDVIELDIPMNATLMRGDEYIQETTNLTAVKRGPIVYCLEGVDLQKNAKVADVLIPNDIVFQAKYKKDLMHGITVLVGDAYLKKGETRDDILYKPLKPQTLEKTKISLIPFYTWSNRGETDMSIWLPLKN